MIQRTIKFLLLIACVVLPMLTAAHPMGNFSIGHATGIQIDGSHLRLRYRLDLAEIPAAEEHITDLKDDAAIKGYLDRKAPRFIAGQTLRLNGRMVPLELVNATLTQRPGAGDLPTALITLDYIATIVVSPKLLLEYEDTNYPARKGWREISVRSWSGWKITQSNVPTESATGLLEEYPNDVNARTPNDRTARVVLERAVSLTITGSTPAPTPTNGSTSLSGGSNTPRDRFTALIHAGPLSRGELLLALAVAFMMGSFHALSPGHGKTVVAAYLVGSRGTPQHALLLGAVVTFTHVAAVVLLGLIALSAHDFWIADDESLYRWLSFISSLLIAAIGVWLFTHRLAKAYAARHQLADPAFVPAASSFSFAPLQPKLHAPVLLDHDHEHGPGGHSHEMPDRITIGSLIGLGISGGIVPCPSAMVVMLAAINLHRIQLGLALIVAFSTGLAMVLIAIGLMMLYARSVLDRFTSTGQWMKRLSIISAGIIAVVGIIMLTVSIAQMVQPAQP